MYQTVLDSSRVCWSSLDASLPTPTHFISFGLSSYMLCRQLTLELGEGGGHVFEILLYMNSYVWYKV